MWNCWLIDTPGGEDVELWAYRYTRGVGVELWAYRYTRGGGCGTVVLFQSRMCLPLKNHLLLSLSWQI